MPDDLKEALLVWMTSMLLVALARFIPLKGYAASTIITEGMLVIPPIVYLTLRPKARVNMLRKLRAWWIILGLILGAGVWLAGACVTHLQDLLIPPPKWYLEELEERLASSLPELASALALSWLVVAPAEELLFRWVTLIPLLERFGWRLGIVLSAALFSISHLDPWNAVSPFLMGLAAGWIVAKAGNLVPAIIIHGTYNSLSHIFHLIHV